MDETNILEYDFKFIAMFNRRILTFIYSNFKHYVKNIFIFLNATQKCQMCANYDCVHYILFENT